MLKKTGILLPRQDRHVICATAVKSGDDFELASVETGELLRLITLGDRVAFDRLYRVQLPLVRASVLRLVRDFHQAEEVAQEVMLQIWQLAARFDPARGSAISWINQIARTRAIDRIRHSQAVRLRDQWYSDREHRTSFDVVSERTVLSVDVANLHRGLTMITPLQREAITLAFFTELNYASIAMVLGVPVSTLKTRIRDGLIRMRKMMRALDEEVLTAA